MHVYTYVYVKAGISYKYLYIYTLKDYSHFISSLFGMKWGRENGWREDFLYEFIKIRKVRLKVFNQYFFLFSNVLYLLEYHNSISLVS